MDQNDILDALSEYKNQFAEKYGILKIGIFGSTARDEDRKDCDVDVIIRLAEPELFTLAGIKQDLEAKFNMNHKSLFPKLQQYFIPVLIMVLSLLPGAVFSLNQKTGISIQGSEEKFPDIQAAIDATKPGDTVLVADGRYTGKGNMNIHLNGKAITVRSASGNPENCILDGGGVENCISEGGAYGVGFEILSGEGPKSVVSGFTITNFYGLWGGGMVMLNSSPTIENCIVKNNVAEYFGGGIGCETNSSPVIKNCVILNNTAKYCAGGVSSQDNSSPILQNCTIKGNSTNEGAGGGVLCHKNSSAVLENCTISHNSAEHGGGIGCTENSSPKINNCSITDNTAFSDGGGIYCSKSSPKIQNCSISHNSVEYGAGFSITDNSFPEINHCSINENSAYSDGGGLYVRNSSPKIQNCIVNGNSAYSNGGGLFCIKSSSTLKNCSIIDNKAGTGGNVFFDDSSSKIENCIISGFKNQSE